MFVYVFEVALGIFDVGIFKVGFITARNFGCTDFSPYGNFDVRIFRRTEISPYRFFDVQIPGIYMFGFILNGKCVFHT